jgi:hypothetical protein
VDSPLSDLEAKRVLNEAPALGNPNDFVVVVLVQNPADEEQNLPVRQCTRPSRALVSRQDGGSLMHTCSQPAKCRLRNVVAGVARISLRRSHPLLRTRPPLWPCSPWPLAVPQPPRTPRVNARASSSCRVLAHEKTENSATCCAEAPARPAVERSHKRALRTDQYVMNQRFCRRVASLRVCVVAPPGSGRKGFLVTPRTHYWGDGDLKAQHLQRTTMRNAQREFGDLKTTAC